MSEQKTILVTGGSGFIGSVTCALLQQSGYNVINIDRTKRSLDGITQYPFDVANNQLKGVLELTKPDAVIHLAAIVGDPACKLYSDLANKTNWTSSKWLIEKSKSAGVSKFIFASTCSNYGKMDDPEAYVDENSKLAPVSLYAELKVKFEKYMLSENQKIDGFFPTSLRFSTVYGLSPRMRFDLTVNEFTKDLALGKELVIFGEQFWRPYCHVKDFSNAFITVLDSPNEKVAYKVFNVGDTKENYTKKMIVNEIVKILPNSKITYVIKNDDPRDYRVNCDKIKNELGFKISMTVPDGIREIKRVIEKNLIKDPENQKYYNTPHGQK